MKKVYFESEMERKETIKVLKNSIQINKETREKFPHLVNEEVINDLEMKLKNSFYNYTIKKGGF